MSLFAFLPGIGAVFQNLGYGLVFIVMISVLVAAHELGHYLFARMFNMGVEEFAIGFGKRPLVTYMRRSYVLPIEPGAELVPDASDQAEVGAGIKFANALEGSTPDRLIERIETPKGPALRETTDFTVRPWPLGGFVRIKGMLPEEDGSEVKVTGGFYSKAPWKRFLVLLAGPLFSVLAGIAILVPVYMFHGMDVPQQAPIIGGVAEGKAAAKAGLQEGDKVLSIDGKPIGKFYDMTGIVSASNGKALTFDIQRAGLPKTLQITPTFDSKPGPVFGPDLKVTTELKKTYRIGVGYATTLRHLSFGESLAEAAEVPVVTVQGVIGLFAKPSDFADSVGGPVSMVRVTAGAVQEGIWKVFRLAALLSISLGIFNLLPVSPLDGGQMTMAVAEMLRGGKRLSIRAQSIASAVGMSLVFALILSVFFIDIRRLLPDGSAAPAASSKSAPKKAE